MIHDPNKSFTDVYPLTAKSSIIGKLQRAFDDVATKLHIFDNIEAVCKDCGTIGKYKLPSEAERAIHNHRTEIHGDDKEVRWANKGKERM